MKKMLILAAAAALLFVFTPFPAEAETGWSDFPEKKIPGGVEVEGHAGLSNNGLVLWVLDRDSMKAHRAYIYFLTNATKFPSDFKPVEYETSLRRKFTILFAPGTRVTEVKSEIIKQKDSTPVPSAMVSAKTKRPALQADSSFRKVKTLQAGEKTEMYGVITPSTTIGQEPERKFLDPPPAMEMPKRPEPLPTLILTPVK